MNGFQTPDEVWLLNCGYVSEHSEQNLLLYGYVSSPGVTHVELMIDIEKRVIRYAIVLDKKAWRRYKLQRRLEGKSGLFWKVALLCFLRRLGPYDPAQRIARCIRDYAGPSWSTSTEVLSVGEYVKIANASGAQGWVFKDGIDDGAATPRQDRPGPAPAAGG